MRKKLISIILAIAMLACMIPLGMVTVSAEATTTYLNYVAFAHANGDTSPATDNLTKNGNYAAYIIVVSGGLEAAKAYVSSNGPSAIQEASKATFDYSYSSNKWLTQGKGRYRVDGYAANEGNLGNIPWDSAESVSDAYAVVYYTSSANAAPTEVLVISNSYENELLFMCSDQSKWQTYTAPAHTHKAGTEYMTDGRAHWLKCADEKCPLKTVEDYEIAFSSYEGPELKETLKYSETCDSMLMGRQGKVNDGVVSKTDGRTIIGLTQDQLGKIGNKLVIVGSDDSDNNKQVSVDVDCAYTWFYNVDAQTGEAVKVEAANTTDLNGNPIAAFVIIDSELVNDTITGFGYYRVYNDIVSDSTLIGEALYKAPRTFKAVYDTTNGANTLNFYFDTEDYYSDENKTAYNNLPTEATSVSQWGYNGIRSSVKGVVINQNVIKCKDLKSTKNMFYGMENALSIKGAQYLDVSSVTDMSAMFYEFGKKSSINEVPAVERWNTSNVENMQQMFSSFGDKSSNLEFKLDLTGWDVSKVSNASMVFTFTARASGKFSVTIPRYTKGLEGIQENSTDKWYTINTSKYILPLSAGTAGKNFIVAQ